jgi:hypothetical protein
MTLFKGLGVVSVMAAFLLSWLFCHLQFSQIRGRRPYPNVRKTLYVIPRALDLANPFDVGTSASGTSTSANSCPVTTTTAHELVFGAGITDDGFSSAGANFTNRIITSPDLDIGEDRFVTATGSYSATASL